jgi:hypothetical protein
MRIIFDIMGHITRRTLSFIKDTREAAGRLRKKNPENK